MDAEGRSGPTEARQRKSWLPAVPFGVVGLVVTPAVMALTGMPEGDRSDLLWFVAIVAVLGAIAGYLAGRLHTASAATVDLLWLHAGFVVGIAGKTLYDGLASSLSLEAMIEGIGLGVIWLSSLGLVVGGLPSLLMRRVGLAVQSRRQQLGEGKRP